jgi:hypothetical protein
LSGSIDSEISLSRKSSDDDGWSVFRVKGVDILQLLWLPSYADDKVTTGFDDSSPEKCPYKRKRKEEIGFLLDYEFKRMTNYLRFLSFVGFFTGLLFRNNELNFF